MLDVEQSGMASLPLSKHRAVTMDTRSAFTNSSTPCWTCLPALLSIENHRLSNTYRIVKAFFSIYIYSKRAPMMGSRGAFVFFFFFVRVKEVYVEWGFDANYIVQRESVGLFFWFVPVSKEAL